MSHDHGPHGYCVPVPFYVSRIFFHQIKRCIYGYSTWGFVVASIGMLRCIRQSKTIHAKETLVSEIPVDGVQDCLCDISAACIPF